MMAFAGERFRDRAEAGRVLADIIVRHRFIDPLVLALPRGGIPVALPVAQALRAPLDLLFVRKIGAPEQPEFALAAVIEGEPEHMTLNAELAEHLRVPADWLETRCAEAHAEIARQRKRYCHGRKRPDLAGRSLIVIDDGIATGTSLRAAIAGLRLAEPNDITVAVPVAPPDTVNAMRSQVDDLICPLQPRHFQAVGFFYDDFHQVEDDEVVRLMGEASRIVTTRD
jgi:putative phosphoribosyl transferase